MTILAMGILIGVVITLMMTSMGTPFDSHDIKLTTNKGLIRYFHNIWIYQTMQQYIEAMENGKYFSHHSNTIHNADAIVMLVSGQICALRRNNHHLNVLEYDDKDNIVRESTNWCLSYSDSRSIVFYNLNKNLTDIVDSYNIMIDNYIIDKNSPESAKLAIIGYYSFTDIW